VFLLSTAYVVSGPALMARGEHLQAKIPVLRAVPAPSAPQAQASDGGHERE
jgi:hypothetical protein